ncbi:uncharacterized protein OGAPODRAFT_94791 [Ogataea polymorpha]|uniref:uncharacterized protein n=1 Tax=Ogataea polymorpha TaxID=460523 RepID=UPI0007F4C432|nr:uncharacterized protein OGAPODRAFT_94791 [Ogataea polymorpha]OBA14948.1 hypothetical protein OGAPODRAFT_94791 [Ogataea polymorpha]
MFRPGRLQAAPNVWKRALSNFESRIARHETSSDDKKDLILTILSSTATKREARNYLSKYPLLKENDIYQSHRRILDSDVVSQTSKHDKLINDLLLKHSARSDIQLPEPRHKPEIQLSDTLRVALIRIPTPRRLDPETLRGIALTLRKLVQLGVSPVLVLDGKHQIKASESRLRIVNDFVHQCDTLIQTLQTENLQARTVRGLFEQENFSLPELLVVPLLHGIVPIIFPTTVKKDSTEEVMTPFETLERLVSNLCGLNEAYRRNNANDLLTVEKIIYLEDLGGIPSLERFQSSHVYINLLQEYNDIISELYIGHLDSSVRDVHVQNLTEMNQLLAIQPAATGLITTPDIATLRHGTRTTNPIIYNVLTDRPTISSSLPVNLKKTPQLNTTVIKRGTPLTIHLSDDQPDGKGIDLLEFDRQKIIDLNKLTHLINDSFGKTLDLEHYLNRVNGNIAAIIIAGDYEGGAIVTWESAGGRRVPYLDKFAVLRKLQGIPGIADIVFKSLLLAYPDELLWRSRQNNPRLLHSQHQLEIVF